MLNRRNRKSRVCAYVYIHFRLFKNILKPSIATSSRPNWYFVYFLFALYAFVMWIRKSAKNFKFHRKESNSTTAKAKFAKCQTTCPRHCNHTACWHFYFFMAFIAVVVLMFSACNGTQVGTARSTRLAFVLAQMRLWTFNSSWHSRRLHLLSHIFNLVVFFGKNFCIKKNSKILLLF